MRHDPRSIERVRRVLLALLGKDTQQFLPEMALLAPDEWRDLAVLASQHRLEPLLHNAVSLNQAVAAAIPPDILASWNSSHRQAAIRSLAAQGTLIRLARLLDSAGIAYAALKGAWLAWHAYASPAMRPMRDIDILVSPANLEGAYRALAAHGFVESTGRPFSSETLAMGLKHLPALRDSTTGVHVELHCRLFADIAQDASAVRLARPDRLLECREWLPLDRQKIAYLPAGDALLHLIVHCIYEHRFDNGPQVLHDIAALLSRQPVDWTDFWSQAAAGGWTRGSRLILRMTEQMLGPQPIVWEAEDAAALPFPVLENAAMLLLQDPQHRRDLDVQRELGSLAAGSVGTAKSLVRRFFPARRVIADFAGLPPEQRRAWLHYPAWLATRLLRTLRGALDKRQRIEAERHNVIESWLDAR